MTFVPNTLSLNDHALDGEAQRHAIECLLNCYLREYALPRNEVNLNDQAQDLPMSLRQANSRCISIRLPSGRLPAPPHDPSGHTWHHPDQVLFDIVKNGLVPGRTAPPGYQSDMPAYGAILSDQDIRDVLAYIKSTWPQSVRAVQEKATLEYARQ